MPDETADFMIMDRLEAWTRIFLKDEDESGIFITHIPVVLEELLERTPTAEKVLEFESIPAGTAISDTPASRQTNISSYLSDIAQNKSNWTLCRPDDRSDVAAAEKTTSLSVYLVPGETPRDFFSRCARIERSDINASCCENKLKNTLIGLIG